MKTPVCIEQAAAGCGEGLLWDATRECLWWVDISKERLHLFEPETSKSHSYPMPYLISALAFRQDGALLIATAKGLGIVEPKTGDIEILHHPEPDKTGNRLNDMAAGPDGQLWVGTMSEGAKSNTGALYCYGPDGVMVQKTGTTISNGLAWSPDGSRLYFIDSVPGILYVLESSIWTILCKFDSSSVKPDGLCVDQSGTLWVALCEQGEVAGISPSGQIIKKIRLPCELVTNCAFGGSDLQTLFITTGTFGMSKIEIAEQPLAGGLFAIEMDVPGCRTFSARWPVKEFG